METIKKAGSINEKGYLAGMSRRGYDPHKCILELGANSLDSLDKVTPSENFNPKVLFDITREKISQIDNGNGMLPEGAVNMFAMHRENHSNEASRGVSGIGAKPSLSNLSGKTHVDIYTRAPNGPHIHISVPWDKIHATGTYTGMVDICTMTPDEQAAFHKEREENGMLNGGIAHGTSIRFKYRDDLRQLLEGSFLPISNPAALTAPLDRMGIVFGHDDIEMVLKTFDTNPLSLQAYDYFKLPDSAYYTGKSISIIEHIRKDDHDRFLLQTAEGYLEIKKDGRGIAKNPEPMTVSRFGYKTIGQFEVVCGLRLDPDIFDPDAPVKYDSGKKNPGHFNESHLGDNEGFLGSYKLVRNNQTIGLIPPPDYSLSSARASGDMYLSYMLVQVEIRFNPMSNQENYQDIAVGIQENKNQFDGANVPKQLTRLVSYAKAEKVKKINAFFKERLDSLVVALPSPPPEENTDDADDTEEATHTEETKNDDKAKKNESDEVDTDEADDADEVDSHSSVTPPKKEQPVLSDHEEEVEIPRIIFGSDLLSHLQKAIESSASYDKESLSQILSKIQADIFA